MDRYHISERRPDKDSCPNAARVELLERCIRAVRQQVHQAHHEGEIEGCPKGTCTSMTNALEGR